MRHRSPTSILKFIQFTCNRSTEISDHGIVLSFQQRERIGYTQATIILWSIALYLNSAEPLVDSIELACWGFTAEQFISASCTRPFWRRGELLWGYPSPRTPIGKQGPEKPVDLARTLEDLSIQWFQPASRPHKYFLWIRRVSKFLMICFSVKMACRMFRRQRTPLFCVQHNFTVPILSISS